jgi:hypothetical protein
MSFASRSALLVAWFCAAGALLAADPPADKSIFDFGKKPAAPERSPARAAVDAAFKQMDEAILRGEYDAAVKAATASDTAARAADDSALIASAATRLANVKLLQAEAARIAAAVVKLTQVPDDADANLAVGRFLCLWRGEWAKGLPLLAKGSDVALQAIAQEDLAAVEAPMQFTVANAWWDLAPKLDGPPRAYAQDRAAEIYLKAVPKLDGFNRTIAQKRIAEAPARLPFPKAGSALAAAPGDDKGGPFATSIQLIADDFACDIYHNGKLIPADHRKLQAEIFGAQGELVTVDLKPGDWIVFNVVNNRLRWGGAYYFAAAGINQAGSLAFVSELRSGNWSACDDLKEIARFVSERDYLKDHKAQAVQNPWDKQDQRIRKGNPDWNGQPIWGDPASRSTWLKYVVPENALN